MNHTSVSANDKYGSFRSPLPAGIRFFVVPVFLFVLILTLASPLFPKVLRLLETGTFSATIWTAFMLMFIYLILKQIRINPVLHFFLLISLLLLFTKGISTYIYFTSEPGKYGLLSVTNSISQSCSVLLLQTITITLFLSLIFRKKTSTQTDDFSVSDNLIISSTIYTLILIFIVTSLKNAWVNEDAFISMRVVENFLNGYGLRWNISDRVQVFTHPLWLFFLTLSNLLIKDAFLLLIIISAVFSLATVLVLVKTPKAKGVSIIIALTALIFSKSFMDFSVNGLENPLSHLLIALFTIVWFSSESKNKVLLLSLITALSGLNRLDTMLIFIPAMTYIFLTSENKKLFVSHFLLGVSPLFAWFLFSLFYYGFIFPNTYYAKIRIGYSSSLLIKQGLVYFYQFMRLDPVGAWLCISAVVIAFFSRRSKDIMLAAGMLLYSLYILKIGGDYMSGRFFTPVITAAAIIISRIKFRTSSPVWAAVLLVVIFTGLSWKYSPAFSNSSYGKNTAEIYTIDKSGVSDQRMFFYPEFGLLSRLHKSSYPGQSKRFGDTLRSFGIKHIVYHYLGKNGYEAGPDIHIIDDMTLTEPLLSKLKAFPNARIGHFLRPLPDGYLETVVTGENKIYSEPLAQYYDKLKFIVSGPLFSLKRTYESIKMNLGFYDSLLAEYYKDSANTKTITLPPVYDMIPEGLPWDTPGNHFIPSGGLKIDLEKVLHAKQIDLLITNNSHQILYMKDGKEIGQQTTGTRPLNNLQAQLFNTTLIIPENISKEGFDSIIIKTPFVMGKRMSCMAYAKFK